MARQNKPDTALDEDLPTDTESTERDTTGRVQTTLSTEQYLSSLLEITQSDLEPWTSLEMLVHGPLLLQ